MRTQTEKGQAFRALHQRKGAFIIPNPWDIGSARMLAQLGFEALATTSGGYAFSMGQRDYSVGRDAVIAHISSAGSGERICRLALISRTVLEMHRTWRLRRSGWRRRRVRLAGLLRMRPGGRTIPFTKQGRRRNESRGGGDGATA